MKAPVVTLVSISMILGPFSLGEGAQGVGRIYTANMESGTISVVDRDSMQVVATIDVRGYQTDDLALSQDQKRLFATNMHEGTLAVVDTVTEQVVATIPTGKGASAVALTPDGKQAWVVNGGEEYLTIIDVSSLKIRGRMPLGQLVGQGHISFSPDGTRAYVTSPASGTVSVIDAAKRTILAAVEVGRAPTFIQVTSDGKRIWGADTGSDEVYALDGATNSLLGKLKVGRAPNDLALIGDTLFVTVGGTNEVVMAGDVDGQVMVKERIPVGGRPRGIKASPDAKRLYVTSEGTNDLHVIDIAARQVIGTVRVGRRPVAVVSAR